MSIMPSWQIRKVACPACEVPPGQACESNTGNNVMPHAARVLEAARRLNPLLYKQMMEAKKRPL